jgi:putative endopeptidase
MRTLLLGLFAGPLLTAIVAAPLAAQNAGAPLIPPAGLDMSATDPATRPGDDFYQYANGAWLARSTIPADRPFVMEWQVMRDRTEAQLHALIEAAAASAVHESTTLEGKVGAFYKSFMDSARLEALGGQPIESELAAIRVSRTRAQLAQRMGSSHAGFEGSFIDFGIDADPKDPGHYAVTLYQNGLSLPDRDYYLKADFARERQEFRSYVERLLTLSRWPAAQANAPAIVALETRIAQASWTKVEQRDPPALYNPMSRAELAAYAPGFPWRAFLRGAGLESKSRVVVAEKTAFPRIAKIFADTPLQTLKAWMAFELADSAAPYLSSTFAAAHFHFHDQMLLGLQEQPARWKLGVRAVSGGDCFAGGPRDCFGTLNWAVGEMYTANYFPPQTKKSIEAMVANITRAYRHRLEHLEWMSDATRAEALRKLDTYVVKVGYPDKARDYEAVLVKDDDLIGNVRRAAAADWASTSNAATARSTRATGK